MKKILCFGEALVDLLSNTLDDDSVTQESFIKFAGGAPANVSVAAAKLGGNAYFSGMLSSDMFGDFLLKSLQKHGVKTDYVCVMSEAKTALAFVSLDDEGERTFEFYRDNSADLRFAYSDFKTHWFEDCSLFHFCSNTLTEQNIYDSTAFGIKMAQDSGCLVSFDINLRLNLWSANDTPRVKILPLLASCNIIKASKEELHYLAGEQPPEEFIQDVLHSGCQLFVVTDSCRPMHWYTQSGHASYCPTSVKMLDATAAGDAFVGGLLYQLGQLDLTQQSLKALCKQPDKLTPIMEFSSLCGAHAASRKGAFVSLPSQQSLAEFRSSL
ncbi:carbohydrate kinase [Paraglaciecola polaris]|uniref:carbohydrate kinase family protein n=1 Tax=Paraglaciecola polaris TaxID=222814 RepID=UPI0030EF9E26